MKKACFIIPYYGKFPDYFPLWLNSANNNPEYDFYFLTDISWNAPLPPNVILVRMALEEIAQRVHKVLKIKAPLHDAYKLCDLRPAYAVLFPEVVSTYPFWGYIDIDMIFGSLSRFLTNEIYEKYDKIGKQGHLTLFRNCEICNHFFMTDSNGKYPDYRTVFPEKYSFHFDESGLIAHTDEYGIRTCAVGDYYDVMPHRFPFLVMLPDGSFGASIPHFCNGHLYLHYMEDSALRKKELLYVHFQKRNMSMDPGILCSDYLAIPNRFVPTSPVDKTLVKSVNKDKIYWNWYKRKYKAIVHSIRAGAIMHHFATKSKRI